MATCNITTSNSNSGPLVIARGTNVEDRIIEGRTESEGRVQTSYWTEERKQQEVHMIAMSYAVVDPRTVVIHLHHTSEGCIGVGGYMGGGYIGRGCIGVGRGVYMGGGI